MCKLMDKQRREENENVGSEGREKVSVAARHGGLYMFPASLPNFISSKALLQESSPNNHMPDK